MSDSAKNCFISEKLPSETLSFSCSLCSCFYQKTPKISLQFKAKLNMACLDKTLVVLSIAKKTKK